MNPTSFLCQKYTRLVFSLSFNIVQKQLLIDGFKSERNGLFFTRMQIISYAKRSDVIEKVISPKA